MNNVREGLNPESLIKKYDLKGLMVSGSTLAVMGERELPQRVMATQSAPEIDSAASIDMPQISPVIDAAPQVQETNQAPEMEIPQIVPPTFNTPSLENEPAVAIAPEPVVAEPAISVAPIATSEESVVNDIPNVSPIAANEPADVRAIEEEDVVTSINRRLVDGPRAVEQAPVEPTLQTPQEFNNEAVDNKENKGVIVDFVAYLVQAQKERILEIEKMQKEINEKIEAHKKAINEEYENFVRKAESIAEGKELAPIVDLNSVREALDNQNRTLENQSYEEKYGKAQGF